MIIGIDIDNTLTQVQKELDEAAYKYAIKIGKQIDDTKESSKDIKNNSDLYKEKFKFTYEELKYFLKHIQEEIANNAKPRKGVVEIIKKLREEGNKIYIVTARTLEFHDDPYNMSKKWLDENNIEYDKIIVNAKEKASVCKNEKIDLFIDDQLNNCLAVSSIGIETIRICDNKDIDERIKSFDNWESIYNYIIKGKIVKIIEYKPEFKNEINLFVNRCMHEFIGRPYKERPDVLNIEDYYLNDNGNFWCVVDVITGKIVGTIALENRGDIGILKRFYVDSRYQELKIGTRLYTTFEQYVITQTNIKKIYLACGNILKKAHKFYIKNGFKQIETFDIEMHVAKDDDFFVKNI